LRVTAIVRGGWDVRRDAWTDGGVREFGHAVTFAVNAMQPVRRVCWPSRVRWVGDSSGIVGATSPISA
jgi:preprotein translocase subunit SecE